MMVHIKISFVADQRVAHEVTAAGFLYRHVPASDPRLLYQKQWYVLSCLWDGAYK